jgi:hypothetical protein
MISTLLLSLALGVAAQPVARPVITQTDDPAIRIWLNEDGRFQRGDEVKVQVRTSDDGYLLVLHLDPDNRLRVLFPLDPNDDNFVRGGKKYQILGRGERETFEVDVRSGRGTVYAAVSRDPYRWDRIVVGDHWDFRALNEVPLSRDVEADLTEFVREIAGADFDYDFFDYDVYERIYASTTHYETIYTNSYWDPYYSTCFGYWRCGGSGVFIGIGIGSPWWYDPYYYGYYPYGYYPVRYYPYYPRYYYPYAYRYPAYHYPYRPFYPYRYRDPYRYRGGTSYAGGYYFGGHYTAPWRNRTNDGFYSTGFAWRGREATTDLAQAGRFSTGFRDRSLERERGRDRGGLSGSRPSTVTPRRRGADAPAPNMTPVRTEGRRSGATAANPVRVGAGADARAPRPDPVEARRDPVKSRRDPAEPRRVEGRRSGDSPRSEGFRDRAPAESPQRDFGDRDLDDRGRGYETGVIRGRRDSESPRVEPRGIDARGPDWTGSVGSDRGAARDDGGRGSRERPQYEPRPAPRLEPRAEPRGEPRAEPRPQPRAEPRFEPRSQPRAEPRSAPRGDGGSAGRGRPRGRA